MLAVAVARAFGAESDLVTQGLLGFSPVLAAIALGVTFRKPSLKATLYAALGVVFTVVAQAALDGAVHPFAPARRSPRRSSLSPGCSCSLNPASAPADGSKPD